LNVTAERIPESQVLLTIEVDPDRVEKSMDRAYRRNVGRVRIPGFRPGKAPRRIFERHVGREALLQEALDSLVPEVVDEAIKAQDLHMVEQPDLEIFSLDPVVIKATVPIRPDIDLGDYRAIRVEREPAAVNDTEVDETLESLRRRYATIEPVERPVEDGDRVRIAITGTVEDRAIISDEDAEVTVRSESLAGLPGVYDHLLGMSKGERAEFDVEVPEDFRRTDIAGKTVHYAVTVNDVKQEVLPELDDDFAREVGEGFDSIDALRQRLTDDARARAERDADSKLQEQAVDALVAQATVEYPPQLVDREIDHMLRDMTRASGPNDRAAVDRFLQQAGRTEDEVRAELRPTASERIKRSLVLARLAELEGIEVGESDIEEELNSLSGDTPQSAQIRRIFDTPSGREMIERQIHSRRTLERLALIATGQAPPIETTPEGLLEAAAEGSTPEPEHAADESVAVAEDRGDSAENQEESPA
jgi:trigger factor